MALELAGAPLAMVEYLAYPAPSGKLWSVLDPGVS